MLVSVRGKARKQGIVGKECAVRRDDWESNLMLSKEQPLNTRAEFSSSPLTSDAPVAFGLTSSQSLQVMEI